MDAHARAAKPATSPVPDEATGPVGIITGAGSGIGRATAIAMARDGWRLVLAGRRLDALEETSRLCASAPTLAVAADVAEAPACDEIVASTLSRFGRIDGLVHCAGAAPLAPIERHTPELIDEAFEVNTLAAARLIAGCWETFLRQHAESGGAARARIVLVSSMASVDPFPGFFAYAAAKAGVNMLALVASREGRDMGVRAFAVAPGAVETPMLRGLFTTAQVPQTRTLRPDEVAGVIAECLRGARDDQSGATIQLASP